MGGGGGEEEEGIGRGKRRRLIGGILGRKGRVKLGDITLIYILMHLLIYLWLTDSWRFFSTHGLLDSG